MKRYCVKVFSVWVALLLLWGSVSAGLPGNTRLLAQAMAQTQEAQPPQVNRALSERATVMVNRLMQGSQIKPATVRSVQVVESDVYNAATNGQDIVFTSALWNAFQNDDQRAFVLSHELAHIVLGHVSQTAVRRIGLGALSQFVFGRFTQNRAALQAAETLGLHLVDTKFSRNMEYQADERGFQIMSQAGYNPQGAIQAFEILKQVSGRSGPEFLQSHPLSESRIRALAKKYESQPG